MYRDGSIFTEFSQSRVDLCGQTGANQLQVTKPRSTVLRDDSPVPSEGMRRGTACRSEFCFCRSVRPSRKAR